MAHNPGFGLEPGRERRPAGRSMKAAPVFPVRDLDAAMAFYERLGFAVRRYDSGYGYAERDGLKLHLRASPELEPFSTYSEV